MVHAIRHAVKELILTGDVTELIRGIRDALRPVLGQDMPESREVCVCALQPRLDSEQLQGSASARS